MSFNGGKMNHIFKMTDDMLYIDECSSEQAQTALLNGVYYFKHDGSNHRIVNEEGQWYIEARYDDRRGKYDNTLPEGVFPICDGANPSSVWDGEKRTHNYYYTRLERVVDGKKAQKIRNAIYNIVDRIADRLNGQNYITCELVGKKFNKTPGIDSDVEIAIHAEQKCQFDGERSFVGIRTFLEEIDVEGLVIEHDGKYWKLHTEKFWPECWWKTRKGEPKNLVSPVIN